MLHAVPLLNLQSCVSFEDFLHWMKVRVRSKQQHRQASFLRQLGDFSTAKDNLSRSMTNSHSWKWRCAPCRHGFSPWTPQTTMFVPRPHGRIYHLTPSHSRTCVKPMYGNVRWAVEKLSWGLGCDSTCKLPVLCGCHCHQSDEIWLSNTHFTVLLSWQTTSTHKQTLDSSLEKRLLGKLLKSLQNYSDWPLKTKRTITGMCSCSKLLLH